MSWNGKIKCFRDNNFSFTKDKVYEVIKGVIIDDKNNKQPYKDCGYKNINDLNEDLCFMFEEIPNPVLCELLGINPNEKFKFKKKDGYVSRTIYWVDEDGWMCCDDKYFSLQNDIAMFLINKEYSIVKLPFYQFAEDEIIIMKGLLLNDYNFIARDKDNDLWAYQLEPLEDESGEYDADDGDFSKLNNGFFKQVQWENVLDIKAELDKLN